MSERSVLGIDIGTSGCKAAVYTFDGRELGVGYAPYELSRPASDRVEMDPEAWWRAACRAIPDATRGCGADAIESIGISSANATVLVDADERPIGTAIMQLDRRARAEAARLRRDAAASGAADAVVSEPAAGVSWAANLAWLAGHRPKALRAARWILFPGGFVALRMTGVGAVDGSRASTTGLLDLRTAAWQADVAERVGVRPEQLPPVMPSDGVCGALRAGVARRLGVRAGTPVVVGAMDSVAAALAVVAVRAGDRLVVLGTMARALGVRGELDARRDTLRCRHAVPGAWADLTVLWGAGHSIAGVSSLWSGTPDYARLEQDLAAIAPGAGGLTYRPPADGDGRRGLRADLDGLRPEHTPAHVARAVLEGLLARLVAGLEPGGRMSLTGGPSHGTAVPQMLADITGVPVGVPPVVASEALGAAICAVASTRALGDLARTAAAMAPARREFTPDTGAHAAYRTAAIDCGVPEPITSTPGAR
jgi:xylulokinase